MEYKKGQRVRIVNGTYKDKGYGTFLCLAGDGDCCVKVDGENQTIALTAIEAITEGIPAAAAAAAATAAATTTTTTARTVVERLDGYSMEEVMKAGAWKQRFNAYWHSDRHDENELAELQDELQILAAAGPLRGEVSMMHARMSELEAARQEEDTEETGNGN